MTQMVKNLPAMRETQVWFLGREDPLEKEMATCSSILAWEIPWTEEPGGLQSIVRRVGHDPATNTFTFHPYVRAVNETDLGKNERLSFWNVTQVSGSERDVYCPGESCAPGIWMP